jgi:hypothetical protein
MSEEMEKQQISNGVGALETGIGALLGLTIEAVTTMPAPVRCESAQYLCVRGKDADGYMRRIMIGYAEVAAPAPNDLDMLKDQAGGIQFFTLAEVLTRRQGGNLFENVGTTKVPQATTEERLSNTQWATPEEEIPDEQSDE